MSVLLLDVGNTRIKWGVLDNGQIRRTGHIAQERVKDKGLQVLTTRLPARFDEAFVSNVAGASFATRLSGVLNAHGPVRFARSERRGWGLTNGYTQPRRMGVDRWVAMVGAWARVSGACLVVDAGTAITLDAIDDDGQHLGGQIIAGVQTMATSLARATSDIPSVKPAPGRDAADIEMFAHNTAGAVREGAQNAVAGAVDRAFRTLQSSGYDASIVLTGGDASRILNALDEAPIHRPHLVLEGLAHMLESAQ